MVVHGLFGTDIGSLIHRDIEPANLHQNGDGVLRLFDPGRGIKRTRARSENKH